MSISPLRYLVLFAAIIFLSLGAMVLIDYWEDPFGIYHYGAGRDWIHSRPYLDDFLAMHKAHEVERAQPEIIFLGDSRVVNGLDPHQSFLPEKTYNLATSGSGVFQNLRYLQHAITFHVPNTVVMGIDLRFFNPPSTVTAEFSDSRLAVREDGSPNPGYRWADLTSTLLSTTAIAASAKMPFSPRTPEVTFDRGFQDGWIERKEGFDFTRRVNAFNASLEATAKSTPYLDANGHSVALDAFRRITALCAEHKIRLIIFALPLHAFSLDVSTSDWKNHWDFIRAVLSIMESTPNLRSEFWDFTGYNAMSTEAFTPASEVRSRTIYYWEYSHFKKIVGDLVLERIFTGKGPKHFGLRATLQTLPQDEARLKQEREAWHEQHQLAPLD